MGHRRAWHIWLIKGLIIVPVLLYQQWGSVSIPAGLSELTGVLGNEAVLFWGLLVYAVLLALPYFPGVEIGFAIMVLFGKQGVTFAYVATLIGFIIAFQAGKLIQRYDLEEYGLYRVCKSDMTTSLARKSPFFALVLLINLPGNIVLGGGGGIALNYGMTKQLNLLTFTLAVAIGVAPLPVLMMLGYSL